MKFNKIQASQSVVNEVVNQIEKAILNKELVSGDKIPTEVELMEQFCVSRNPIREAIKILTALGLLEVKRGQGTFIVDRVHSAFYNPLVFSMILEPQTNYHLYELRLSIDSMILLLIIDKLTNENLVLIEETIKEVKDKYEKEGQEDIDFYLQKDIEFHQLLMNLTENPLIIKTGTSILELYPAYIKKSIMQPGGIKRSIENHMDILNLLQNRDKGRVLEIVENSLKTWKNDWV